MVSSIRSGIWLLLIVVIALSGVMSISAVSGAKPHDGINVLGLDEALTRALEKHPTVDTVQAERESKELMLARRSAVYGPRLSTSFRPLTFSVKQRESQLALGDSFSINGNLSTLQGLEISAANRWQSGDGDQEKSGLTVRASLKLWPPSQYDADYLNLLEAKESISLAARQEAEARAQAVIDTYRRYRTLQINRARSQVYEKEHGARSAEYDRVIAKAKQGLVSTVEVIAALQEKEESLAVHEKALRDYRRELRSFLSDLSLNGATWELEQLPDRLSPGSLEMTEDEAVALALEADTTLIARDQALAAARRQVDAARAANGIELSLGSNAEFPRERGAAYEAYMSFSYPLMDGGLRKIESREADLALQQAEKAVQDQQSKVCLEVESKLSELQWLEAQMRIAGLNHEKVALQSNARLLQAANGLIPEAEAEASERLLEQARLDWFEAVVAYEMARLEFMLMTGQPVDLEGGYPH